MIAASKSTLSLNNFKILRPKVTENIANLCKKFCESPPRALRKYKECHTDVTQIYVQRNILPNSHLQAS